MRDEEKKEIDDLVGDFFFGCNIPFLSVESKYFRALLHKLNPNYKPPSRFNLSNEILNRRFAEHQKNFMKDNGCGGVLLIDGWKNSAANTKNVVAMIRLWDGRFIFLDSWNFSGVEETGEHLVEIVEYSTEIALQRYNIRIYAIVSDNASNVVLMGNLSDLWHVTCNSHSGNLYCKTIINHNQEIAYNTNKLAKEFKSPKLEHELVNRGGVKMSLISETRWCTHRDLYKKALRNLDIMRQIVAAGADIKPENLIFLQDPTLTEQLVDQLLILDPICKLIRTCEKNNKNISDSTEIWLKLELPVVNEDYEAALQSRVKKALNVYGLTANLLNHNYKGLRYVNNLDYVQKVDEFLRNEMSDNGLEELEHYKNGTGRFEGIMQKNFKSWEVFWKSSRFFYPELSTLALKLLNIPASTAQLERLFSQWAYVHNKKRNRLRQDRSAKLISLYYTYRAKEPESYLDSSEESEDE